MMALHDLADGKNGFFITFEGGEGAGKSSQIGTLAGHLRQSGFNVVVTREPGGSKGAEAVRHVLLSGAAQEFGPHVEALLFAAARQDHVTTLIAPALAEGKIVLCDRFTDSTRAYQGGEGAISDAFLNSLDAVSLDGLRPDLTLLLDVPSQTGMNRAGERRGDDDIDRFEKDDLKIHKTRRKVFLQLARAEPDRIVVIDASQPIDVVGENIWKAVEVKLAALPQSRLAKPGDV